MKSGFKEENIFKMDYLINRNLEEETKDLLIKRIKLYDIYEIEKYLKRQ